MPKLPNHYQIIAFFRKTKKSLFLHVGILLVSCFIGGFTAANLNQDVNYDLLNYHYHNPYSLVHDRIGEDIGVGGLESYINPTLDVPGYLLINHLSPRAAATVLGLIQGVNIFLIFEICLLLLRQKLKDSRYLLWGLSYILAVLSFFCASNWSEVGSTMGDNLASIFVFCGLLLCLYAYSTPTKLRLLTGAGFYTMGVAVGLKLTSVIYALALIITVILFVRIAKKRTKFILLNLALMAGGAVTSAGFWYVRMIGEFKSPLFPFYNSIFKSPFYPQVNFEDSRWVSSSVWYSVTLPFRYVSEQSMSSEIPFRDPRIAVLFVSVVIFGLYLLYKGLYKKVRVNRLVSIETGAFLTFLVLGFIIWSLKFSYYRYALPLEMLSLVGVCLVILSIIKNWRYGLPIIIALVIWIQSITIPINWGRVAWQPTYFGVTQNDFAHLENGTILLAGMVPFGFAVPYFPDSSTTIRIESDLTSPTMGTERMQAVVRSKIHQAEQKKTKFYALKADEESAHEEFTFNSFGYHSANCKELPVPVRADSSSKYRICDLQKNN